MGLGLDLANTERLVLIAGGEKVPTVTCCLGRDFARQLACLDCSPQEGTGQGREVCFHAHCRGPPIDKGSPAAAPPTEATPLAATTTLPEAKSFEPSPASAPAASPSRLARWRRPCRQRSCTVSVWLSSCRRPCPICFRVWRHAGRLPLPPALLHHLLLRLLAHLLPLPPALLQCLPSVSGCRCFSTIACPFIWRRSSGSSLAASGKAPTAATPFSTAPAASGMAPAAATPFSAAPAAVASAKPEPEGK